MLISFKEKKKKKRLCLAYVENKGLTQQTIIFGYLILVTVLISI